MNPQRLQILYLATQELDYAENPPTSNKTKYGAWFGLDAVPWCGTFCSYIYAEAGLPLGNVGFSKGFASVPLALTHWADKKTNDPQPGDLVIYDWNNDKQPDHVGIFGGWTDKLHGMFWAIEGNTSYGNQSNGGQVMKRERHTAMVEAFLNPLDLPA
jgi:hypothetical protein